MSLDTRPFVPQSLVGPLESQPGRSAQLALSGTALIALGGPEGGAKSEHAVLQAFFAERLNLVERWGGEAVWASARELVAWWPDGHDMARSLAAAASCGLALAEGQGLQVGFAQGQATVARMGTQTRTLTLDGPACADARNAAQLAEPGEVCLDAKTGAQLGLGVQTEWVGSFGTLVPGTLKAPLPPLPMAFEPPTEAQATAYLPTRIRTQIATLRSDWLGERRTVSVAMASAPALSPSTRDGLRRLESALESVREAVAFSEGELTLHDVGGAPLFGLMFGLRAHTHADDLQLAAEGALAMTRALARVGLTAGAGIARGPVFDGPLGAASRMIWATVGPPIERAAKLASEGIGVLLDGALTQELDATFDLRPLPNTHDASRLLGRRKEAAQHRVLFGRDRLVRQLTGRLDALVNQGRSGLVGIVAEPGMGKSALLSSAVAAARAQGVRVVRGFGSPIERGTSFHPWRQIFEALLEVRSDLLTALKVALRDAPQIAERLPLLNDALPLGLPDTDTTRHLTGESRGEASRLLMAQTLAFLAAGPMVIALDDVHQFDSASIKLLQTMARQPQVLILAATRPGPAEPLLVSADPEHLPLMALQALSLEDTTRVAEAALGRPIGAELAQYIDERAGGNPLFAEQTAMLLADADTLEGAELALKTDAEWRASAPATVHGMVTQRIDRLSATAQLALKAASVIGGPFNAAQLHAVHPAEVDRAALDGAIATLLERGLIKVVSQAPTFTVAHAITAEVAYGLLLHEHRVVLHGRVARWLQSDPEGAQDSGRLAYHWRLAEDPRQTVRYCELAGTRALRAGAFREAADFLSACVDTENRNGLAPQTTGPLDAARLRHIRWHRQLSDAYHGMGDVRQRGEAALRALELGGDTEPQSRSKLRLSASVKAVAMLLSTQSAGTPPADSLAAERELEMVRAWRQRAAAHFFDNRDYEILFATLQAARYARNVGPSPELAGATAELAGCYGVGGFEGTARKLFDRAEQIALDLDDTSSQSYVSMVRALYLAGLGQWDALLACVDQAQAKADSIGDAVVWGNAQAVRFWRHHYLGEHREAQTVGQSLYASARQNANAQHEAWALRCAALTATERGDIATAIESFQRCLALLDSTQDRAELLPTWGGLAVALLQNDDPEGAEAAMAKTLTLIGERPRPGSHIMVAGYAGAAEVAVTGLAHGWAFQSVGGYAAIEKPVFKALDALAHVLPIGVPHRALWRGLALCFKGKTGPGQRTLKKGLAAAQTLKMGSVAARLTTALADPFGALRA